MKRKRGFMYYDSFESEVLKRRKIADSLQDIDFVKVDQEVNVLDGVTMKFKTIKPNEVKMDVHFLLPKKFEQPNDIIEVMRALFAQKEPPKKQLVGFSSINKEVDVQRVFGKKTVFLPKWKFDIPMNDQVVNKYALKFQEKYVKLCGLYPGKKESDDRIYITEGITNAVDAVMEAKPTGKQLMVFTEHHVQGKDAKGPLDFFVCGKESALVVVEAKRGKEIDSGVPQLLMQLKAVQEQEQSKNKWYYGIAATRNLWTPCRVNMEGDVKVQIGEEIALNKRVSDCFYHVLNVMKRMILKEFD